MTSNQTVNPTHRFNIMNWENLMSGLCTLAGSLLVSMQSKYMNPPLAFDAIQTRVDAFVR